MNGEKLYLRKANNEDVDLLFKWVNDQEVRKNSFDTHIITYEEHCVWFAKMQEDEKQLQYILMFADQPIGQIRLTINNGEALISYSICKMERRRGFGKAALALVKEKIQEDCPGVIKLIGRVKADNISSCHVFTRNGFEETYKQYEYLISNGSGR